MKVFEISLAVLTREGVVRVYQIEEDGTLKIAKVIFCDLKEGSGA